MANQSNSAVDQIARCEALKETFDLFLTSANAQPPAAAAVLIPGWQSSCQRPTFLSIAAELAQARITVARFDPCYIRDPARATLPQAVAELAAVERYLQKYSSRILLYGSSFGGLVIANALAEREAAPAALILRAPALRSGRYPAEIDVEKGLELITRTSAPLLLIHGENDEVVPLSISEEVVSRRRTNGLTTDLTILPNGEHRASTQEIPEMIKAIRKFVRQNLLADIS